jgi:Spermine/spermidine synthase domain
MHRRNILKLFLASFLALYFELVVIRYLSTEIRIFAYVKNLALVASFFGIGLGMMVKPPKLVRTLFSFITALLFLIIAFAPWLRLTHLPVPGGGYEMFGHSGGGPEGAWGILWLFGSTLLFFIAVPGILYLVVIFFVMLGGLIGEQLALLQPLRGYGWNLAGSLAGILAFTALSFSGAPPSIWLAAGAIVAIPFFTRDRWTIAVFLMVVGILALPPVMNLHDHNYDIAGLSLSRKTFWSPYYRITLYETPAFQNWARPSAYILDVNHDYHQKILDLSPEFLSHRFSGAELNRQGAVAYALPYRLASHPQRVLVVGAGTGNDVAAALRNGATHVDAVEIDPLLIKLGRLYHPERPYDSPKVTVVVDDARAYFKRANQKYDLIVFGFLDSHTMFSSLSVLRLDDYVYTLESYREAKSLLAARGTMVLGFDSGRSSYITDRIFYTLSSAFGKPPNAYFTGWDGAGVEFVEGEGSKTTLAEYPEISAEIQSRQASVTESTDRWPFLYLRSRTIPISMVGTIILFVVFCLSMLRRHTSISQLAKPQNLHFFLLGAGFMLLETKAVTELSLLFGSTWVVNSVVITAFLVMAMLGNLLVIFRQVPRQFSYLMLFLSLVIGLFLPQFHILIKAPFAAFVTSVPIFFSALIFSSSFRSMDKPAEGLGVNLLGAVMGGLLENTVMIGGTPILGILALVLYGSSALALRIGLKATHILQVNQPVPSLPDM